MPKLKNPTKTQHKKICDRLWSEAVRLRDNNTCQKCGATNGIDAHHVICKSVSLLLRHDLRNGIALCNNCHTFGNESAHKNGLQFAKYFERIRPDDYKFLMKWKYKTAPNYDYKLTELSLKEYISNIK